MKTPPGIAVFILGLLLLAGTGRAEEKRPNVVFVIADQWRAQAFGFAGDPNVKTPQFDQLARESVRCVNAVSGMPVCTPMRASLITGQRPLTHGLFINDVSLNPEAVSVGKVMKEAGYDTGFIGKWHVDGHGRASFIPRERRQGFDYWKVLECTHSYTESLYYGDTPEKMRWSGYDAIDQTRDAVQFLRDHAKPAKPFVLFLAWGPPHDPYLTAPEKYRAMYHPDQLTLRGNVPPEMEQQTRRNLAGYYAHCSALDDCLGELRATLKETGLDENTLLVFTADHGDMMGSHGMTMKQKPYDESACVPLLWHWPGQLKPGGQVEAPVNSEDLMPTVLGFCGIKVPGSVEGLDFSGHLRGGSNPGDGAAVLTCVAPFGQWERRKGGREYRGLRTARYTYVRDLNGPWLLFDNQTDPLQMKNLAGTAENASLQAELDEQLTRKLKAEHDEFLPGDVYIKKWGWVVDANGTASTAP